MKRISALCSVCEKNFLIEKIWMDIANDFPDRKQDHIDLKCPNFMEHIKIQRQKEVAKIPIETKQKVLDLFRSGLKIGEIEKQLNLSLDATCEIITQNIEAFHYLRTEAK
jgi:cell division protein FtsX